MGAFYAIRKLTIYCTAAQLSPKHNQESTLVLVLLSFEIDGLLVCNGWFWLQVILK